MRITQRIFDLYFGGICDDERVIQRRAGAISETTSESKRILLKEIGSKWDKFSAHNLSALKHTHDLVPQVVEIYQLYESIQYPFPRRATSQLGSRHRQMPIRAKETPMKFRPLHDRVVVKRIEAEDKTESGIIIPDTAKEKPSQGEVIAVGPGGRDEAGHIIPVDLKVGDFVLFGKWSGTEVKIDGVELLIMKESDIMGVLTEAVSKKKAA